MLVLGQVVAPRFFKPCDSTVPVSKDSLKKEDPSQRRLIRRGVKITDGYPHCFYSSTNRLAMLYSLKYKSINKGKLTVVVMSEGKSFLGRRKEEISEDEIAAGLYYHIDILRWTTLAKLIMGEDCKGDIKKSVKELETLDTKAVDDCKRLTRRYSIHIFDIYQNGKDPFFLPARTASHGEETANLLSDRSLRKHLLSLNSNLGIIKCVHLHHSLLQLKILIGYSWPGGKLDFSALKRSLVFFFNNEKAEQLFQNVYQDKSCRGTHLTNHS